MMCDVETGMCALPESGVTDSTLQSSPSEKPLKVIYFTDPICSTCWGIEPQLRKLKLEHGHLLTIEYRMGGLLPDWDYSSGGISKPSDVATHWDEGSAHYDMPIDGDVWLEDPLYSSYPPSVAVKAAQIQDGEKAVSFLRRIREMVFLEKKNITRREHLLDAASYAGLDVNKFEWDLGNSANDRFQSDLEMAKQFGVRGFPTFFITAAAGTRQKIYGIKPYAVFENAVTSLLDDPQKTDYPRDWSALFTSYPTLTTREFAELSDRSKEESQQLLHQLVSEGKLEQQSTKNGVLWKRK